MRDSRRRVLGVHAQRQRCNGGRVCLAHADMVLLERDLPEPYFSVTASAATGRNRLKPLESRMDRVRQLEHQIENLSSEELARLRRWFAEFDAQAWDHQFESDVRSGKLDALSSEAVQSHLSGTSRKL